MLSRYQSKHRLYDHFIARKPILRHRRSHPPIRSLQRGFWLKKASKKINVSIGRSDDPIWFWLKISPWLCGLLFVLPGWSRAQSIRSLCLALFRSYSTLRTLLFWSRLLPSRFPFLLIPYLSHSFLCSEVVTNVCVRKLLVDSMLANSYHQELFSRGGPSSLGVAMSIPLINGHLFSTSTLDLPALCLRKGTIL